MKRTLENRIRLSADRTAYLEHEFRLHFPDAWIAEFDPLVEKMTNDPKDRHVLAAAVQARAHCIVTFNKRHFPAASTSPMENASRRSGAFLETLYAGAAPLW
jgi:hypothetical protein